MSDGEDAAALEGTPDLLERPELQVPPGLGMLPPGFPEARAWVPLNKISFGSGFDSDLQTEIANSDIKVTGIQVTDRHGEPAYQSATIINGLCISKEELAGLRPRDAARSLSIIGMGMGPAPLVAEARVPNDINERVRAFLKDAKPGDPPRLLDLTCS